MIYTCGIMLTMPMKYSASDHPSKIFSTIRIIFPVHKSIFQLIDVPSPYMIIYSGIINTDVNAGFMSGCNKRTYTDFSMLLYVVLEVLLSDSSTSLSDTASDNSLLYLKKG